MEITIKARSRIRGYIAANHLPPGGEVADDVELFEAGVLDSAALLSMVSWIEAEFRIEIPDEDLLPRNFASIASASAYVASRSNMGPVA